MLYHNFLFAGEIFVEISPRHAARLLPHLSRYWSTEAYEEDFDEKSGGSCVKGVHFKHLDAREWLLRSQAGRSGRSLTSAYCLQMSQNKISDDDRFDSPADVGLQHNIHSESIIYSHSTRSFAKQASELLPLWEMDKVLADSDTSAQDEIDATVREIKEELTPTQLQTIIDMKLTEQDVSAFEQSLSTSVQSADKNRSSSGQSSGSDGPDGGPGGDGLTGILMGVSQGSTSSTQSTQGSSGTSSQIPAELINALIKVLQKKSSA